MSHNDQLFVGGLLLVIAVVLFVGGVVDRAMRNADERRDKTIEDDIHQLMLRQDRAERLRGAHRKRR